MGNGAPLGAKPEIKCRGLLSLLLLMEAGCQYDITVYSLVFSSLLELFMLINMIQMSLRDL